MEIVAAKDVDAAAWSEDIAELAFSTGPASYLYHIGRRDLFDRMVGVSWTMDGSLFSREAATLAVEDGKLAGLLVSFPAEEFVARREKLADVAAQLIAAEVLTLEEAFGIQGRIEHGQWLNPWTLPGVYYIHAIAVTPEMRGRKLGKALFDVAIEKARAGDFPRFQLDVLSDNQAVGFYRSQGMEVLVESKAPKPFEAGVPVEYRMGMTLQKESAAA